MRCLTLTSPSRWHSPQHTCIGWIFAAGLLVVAFLGPGNVPAADERTQTPRPSARWESAIKAFERQDEKNPPPENAVLFVGSSSIRLWKLETSFPGIATINRGFGGSEISDSVDYADRIVVKYQPRVIVFYAGDNDLAKQKTPQTVIDDFKTFAGIVREKLPESRLAFIAIKPSLSRWGLAESIQKTNQGIAAVCAEDQRLQFVDIWEPMLGDDGRPRPELFAKDGLHMSPAGYAIWSEKVLPLIAAGETGK